MLALLPGLLLCVACGKSGVHPGGGDLAMDQGFTVSFGPITVPAGTERTQCVVKRLGNPTAIHVGTIHNLLGTSSHHMIVYRVADTTEQPTPVDCQPFKDTLNPAMGSPLMITQKKEEVLQLPQGVAYSIGANQMVRLEMHYINSTSGDVTLMSSSTFIPIPDSQFQNEADFLFVGDPDISIPAGQSATLGPIYFTVPSQFAGVNFFALTGHEHHLGTNVTISTATSKTDPGTSVYNVPNWTWSEPATVFSNPPFQIPSGGGFKFTCDWTNTTANPVAFGESANDEMCFFWAYYYPSQGAHVCFHTDRFAGGIDLCCPDAGQQICSMF
jgi:hypothetical protein